MRRADGKEKSYTPLNCIRCKLKFNPVSGRQLACHVCKAIVEKERVPKPRTPEQKQRDKEKAKLKYHNASPEQIKIRKEKAEISRQKSLSKLTPEQNEERKRKAREAMKKRYEDGKCKPSKMPASYYRKKRKVSKNNLSHRMQNGIRLALKSKNSLKNGRSWEKLVGYTVFQLKEHLEKLFVDGMNWQNMNLWHIDHIYPKSKCDYSTADDDDFKKCWSLDNLQPLWAKDNLIKKDKILEGVKCI